MNQVFLVENYIRLVLQNLHKRRLLKVGEMKEMLFKTSGFTLIECLIVLMITVIVVSILTPKIADAIYYMELKRCTINTKT